MLEELLELQQNSYSPYSNYKVASIVIMKDGTKFSGVNVESASYGATICAERVAIDTAIASGYKVNDFKELYIMVDKGNIGTPCFLCRDIINEFFPVDAKIICMNQQGEKKEYLVKDLCTHPFGKEDLE